MARKVVNLFILPVPLSEIILKYREKLRVVNRIMILAPPPPA
jgi:hypothetical protein